MYPGLARYRRRNGGGLHDRRHDPLLLRSRPPAAPLNRCNHFDLRLRRRTIPRISPMTPHGLLALAQGGDHREDTLKCIITSQRKSPGHPPRALLETLDGSIDLGWKLQAINTWRRPGRRTCSSART
jgi:hypothetical protein